MSHPLTQLFRALLLALTSTAHLATAQDEQAYLVRDINTAHVLVSSDPSLFTATDNTTLFLASSPATGTELWRTDGTADGTMLVRDVRVGNAGSGITGIVTAGEFAFFFADDGEHGRELWKSDGTPAGTSLVRDLCPGTCGTPGEVVAAGKQIFFTVDRELSVFELWATDGTSEGTRFLKELPIVVRSVPRGIAVLNGDLVLIVDYDVWTSDGTTAGTVLLTRLPSTIHQIGASRLLVVGDVVFFVAGDGSSMLTLWRTDGTTAGTHIVPDPDGNSLVYPGLMAVLDGTVIIGQGTELWKISPTSTTFSRFATLPTQSPITNLASTGKRVFFIFFSQLWVTDGTDVGTRFVAEIPDGAPYALPANFTTAGDDVFFSMGTSLWHSDGTTAGTQSIHQWDTGRTSSGLPQLPTDFFDAGGILLLRAYATDTGAELWRSNGSIEGTVAVANIADETVTAPSDLEAGTSYGGKVFFAASDVVHGQELWASDGTANGTVLLRDINPGQDGSFLSRMVGFRGNVFFSAYEPIQGLELWKSDGTTAGTRPVRDIQPGRPSSNPDALTLALGSLFFSAISPESYSQLWKTDGSESGTLLIWESTAVDRIFGVTAASEAVYFVVSGESSALWRSDGTTSGTTRVRQFDRGTALYPYNLVAAGNDIFFQIRNAEGWSMWSTDGSEAHTGPVTATQPSADFGFQIAFGGKLFFIANAESPGLWRSDGTTDGTSRVVALPSASGFEGPKHALVAGGKLFFVARDDTRGAQLWVSDGTTNGTVPLTLAGGFDCAGTLGQPQAIQGRVVFASWTSDSGCEPWISDGTAAGTRQLADIWPGPEGSVPGSAMGLGQIALIAAFDPLYGRELWAVRLGPASHCAGDCNDDGDVTVDDLVQLITLALDPLLANGCTRSDFDNDGVITVDEIITAITAALDDCAVGQVADFNVPAAGGIAQNVATASRKP